MNKQLLKAIKELQRKLKKGDAITIWKDEFQVALDGMIPTNYSEEPQDNANQMEIAFEMRSF
tara:strand:- start:112 stop:297 length:186 start_codon:yes stop_codon:yes gene_type:complete